jgi:serine/threonine protein kinase
MWQGWASMEEFPEQVGPYRIVRVLGRGGMAVVYLARQPALARDVAVKELARVVASDPSLAQRFIREARVAGSLNHPNVVTVYDFLEHDGVPYIAMEYLERGSLRPFVGKLSLAQAAGVLEGLLAALSHAEAMGIVHRDVKPENLLVTAEGGIKIADFGIAKAVQQVATEEMLTPAGATVGTPAYMAPEQAMASGIGPWTDLYQSGIVAFELLSGAVPFCADETPIAVMMQHISDPLPPLPEGTDPALDAWVRTMVAKDPGERFPSAAVAWEELEEIVIRLAGPLWRRGARLADPEPTREQSMPLSPAPFTWHEPTPPPPPATTPPPTTPTPPTIITPRPAPPPPPPPPPTTPAEPLRAPGVEPPPASPDVPSDGDAGSERGYRTYRPVPLPSPPAQTPPPRPPEAAATPPASPPPPAELPPDETPPPAEPPPEPAVAWRVSAPSRDAADTAAMTAPMRQSTPPRWRPFVLPIVVLGLLVVAAVAAVVLSGGDDGGPEATVTRTAGNRFPVGDKPDGVALGAGAAWVALSGEGKLARVDQDTGKSIKVDVGKNPDSVVFDGDSVWVSVTDADQVVQVSADAQPKVIRKIDVGLRPEGLDVSSRAVWVANSGDGSVSQVVKASGTVNTVPDVASQPVDVAIGAGAVWVAGSNGRVVRIDGGKLTFAGAVDVGPNPRALAIIGQHVWAISAGDGHARSIDSDTNTIDADVDVGGRPADIATDGRHLWVTDSRRDRVSELDPAAGRVVGTETVRGRPLGVAADDRAVWATAFDAGVVARLTR